MERDVSYCTTGEGLRRGYWKQGGGPQLVSLAEPELVQRRGEHALKGVADLHRVFAVRTEASR